MEIIVYILLGTLFLYWGAEKLVQGAADLALTLGVSSLTVGLTVVAFGTSLPEAISSLVAQIKNPVGEIALSNVVGSNLANMGLVLGISASIQALKIEPMIRRESYLMLGATFFVVGSLVLGVISRLFAVFYLVALGIYVLDHYKRAVNGEEEESKHLGIGKDLSLIAIGAGVLFLGGYLLVEGAVQLAKLAGLSERVIGLTVVALGTSLPELATSLVALWKGEHKMLLGNIVGSNLFNLLFILGSVSLIYPISIPSEVWRVDIPLLCVLSLGLTLVLVLSNWLSRVWGVVLLLTYAGYLASLFA